MELGGQILENKQHHDELADQMRHVEAVIKMLDPAYNIGPDRGETPQAEQVVQAGATLPEGPRCTQNCHAANDSNRHRRGLP
jgi:hypothetical protein